MNKEDIKLLREFKAEDIFDIEDDKYYVVYPTIEHKKDDLRWWMPGRELIEILKLRDKIEEDKRFILWSK